MKISINEVHQRSSYDHVCKFEMDVVYSNDNIEFAWDKITNNECTDKKLAEDAIAQIRKAVGDWCKERNCGIRIRITKLWIHDVDYISARFYEYTLRELRKIA